MSEDALPTPVTAPAAPPPRFAGSPLGAFVAWIVLIFLAVGWVVLNREERASTAAISRVEFVDELNARIVLSLREAESVVGPGLGTAGVAQIGNEERHKSVAKECAYSILDALLLDPKRAAEELTSAGADWKDNDAALRDACVARMQALAASETVLEFDGASTDRLGYFAKVLDGREHASLRPILAMVFAVAWYGIFGPLGLILLTVCLVFSALGHLPARTKPASPAGLILMETFTIWFVVFLGSKTLLDLVPESLAWVHMLGTPLLFFGSLLVLFWPKLRGVSWSETRRAIGWRTNGLFMDICWGVIGYAMALPCLGAGLLIMFALREVVGESAAPSHPAVEHLGEAGFGGLAILFFLACIAAPIVEETVFRGVFYRHLRDVTALGRSTGATIMSVTIAATISSALFAAIHPQGLLFAPVLAGLAFGFCLLREWRGSVLSGMVAHGIQNAVTLALATFLQS